MWTWVLEVVVSQNYVVILNASKIFHWRIPQLCTLWAICHMPHLLLTFAMWFGCCFHLGINVFVCCCCNLFGVLQNVSSLSNELSLPTIMSMVTCNVRRGWCHKEPSRKKLEINVRFQPPLDTIMKHAHEDRPNAFHNNAIRQVMHVYNWWIVHVPLYSAGSWVPMGDDPNCSIFATCNKDTIKNHVYYQNCHTHTWPLRGKRVQSMARFMVKQNILS